ncbi:late blight resistance protein R1-A-like [Pistacia vera]|uniref:late blight resistance protein R1-A-like n=1 Tax=Pistacia vera TaxID=55513 RepID=UPI0012638595|nr:late blight resistance protein R1-A-like [Pistacia vera]
MQTQGAEVEAKAVKWAIQSIYTLRPKNLYLDMSDLLEEWREMLLSVAQLDAQGVGLGKSSGRPSEPTADQPSYEGVGSFDEDYSGGESEAPECSLTPPVDRELNDKLFHKYGGYISTLKHEFSKKKKKGKLPKEARQFLFDWWSVHNKWPYLTLPSLIMAEAIVSAVLRHLGSIIAQEIQQEVKLVVGVDKEVKKLRSNLEAIEAVLVDVEERQMKKKTISLWLDQLKHASYDIEDVLDEWNYAMLKLQIERPEDDAVPKKVCFSFPSSCFSFKQVSLHHDIAMKIKDVTENLDDIAKQKDKYAFNTIRSVEKSERLQSTSFVDVSELCGRVDDKNSLVRKLCDSSEEHLPVIPIIEMGGIGKTTLAQFSYKDNEVINNFEKKIWVCVSEPFDEYRIARAIIEALESFASNVVEYESLLQHISKSIVRKKYLLVLDDVWNEDYKKWEPLYHCLKNGLHGSKILITTRKELVARMMGSIDIINVKELLEEDCWLLFRQLAFFGMSQEECKKFEEIGRLILRKCKGLPLAVKLTPNILPKLFDELTSLKALTIAPSWRHVDVIEYIPKEVGKLIHLRELEELPQGIGKLIELRHLENYGTTSLRKIPIGIQRLSNLRILREFVLSGGGGSDNKTCSLEGLKYLNLFEELYIRGLGNISDVNKVKRSKIKNQKNLLHLTLDFRKDERERTNEDDEALLEILQPSLNLEKLRLDKYRGNTIMPNWMMSLTNLSHLTLRNCINCKHLSSLGKLPSLESFSIWAMKSVKRVSNEFLGIESDGTSSSFIFFPKLKTLTFQYMDEWEEWDYETTRNREEDDITIMPSLVSLSIYNCSKLKALPNHLDQNTTLKKDISRCPLLHYG